MHKFTNGIRSLFISELHDAFVLFDVNHDGRITESELNSMLCFLGIKASASDVKKMIADADIDGEFALLLTCVIVLSLFFSVCVTIEAESILI